jgi:uncharacterized protein YdeI (YjbR/CyaY-like superfamily)
MGGPGMITEVEEYFDKGCGRCDRFATADCATRRWSQGLAALRALCLQAGLGETVKWGHPCYVHAGRNVALIGALRGDFRLSFFEAGLMSDPEGILERQGPNTRQPGTVRFSDAARVATLAPVLLAYLEEAKGHAAAGHRAPRDSSAPDLPEELTEALDADPELAEAFAALTPGRQRSYAIALVSAKASATRRARIARFRDRIIAGKGANER